MLCAVFWLDVPGRRPHLTRPALHAAPLPPAELFFPRPRPSRAAAGQCGGVGGVPHRLAPAVSAGAGPWGWWARGCTVLGPRRKDQPAMPAAHLPALPPLAHARRRHVHTNPLQVQEVPAAALRPGCSYSSWFQVLPWPRGLQPLGEGSCRAAAGCAAAPAARLRDSAPRACCLLHHPAPPRRTLLSLHTLPGAAAAPRVMQPGDYHDVLLVPMLTRLASLRVRLQPGEFTG